MLRNLQEMRALFWNWNERCSDARANQHLFLSLNQSVNLCLCVCVTLGVIGILFGFDVAFFLRFWFSSAGGTGGADETGANKDTHQSPVIQLETSNCVPANFPIFCMA